MDKVYAKIKGSSTTFVLEIEQIRNGSVLEQDIEEMWCIDCGAPAHIYHHENGHISFRSIPHKKGCYTQTVEGEQDEKLLVKAKRIYIDTEINRDLILYGNDREPCPEPPSIDPDDDSSKEKNHDSDAGDQEPAGESLFCDPDFNPVNYNPDDLEKRDTAYYYRFGIKRISCIKTLFNEIRAKGFGFDMGDGHSAGNLVLDNVALKTIRRTGFAGEKIVILRRCGPGEITYARKIGLLSGSGTSLDYVVLKDAFSLKPENMIFFLLKCKNQKQNEYFKDLIMGSSKKFVNKDGRKYIVVYSFFKAIPNDYNQVYKADITFRQYGLFNDVSIGDRDD